jgi:hypothetical protein
MDNHDHLLVETVRPTLGRGMRHLGGVYSQRLNRAHGRVGHVFQGRYKAILVERDAHLLELGRYVVLNPLRAGMVQAANDWRWSSDRAEVADRMPAAGDEVPRLQRHPTRPALSSLGESTQKRGEWMTAAYREHGYLLTEIAAHAGLHYSSISKIIKAWAEAGNSRIKT